MERRIGEVVLLDEETATTEPQVGDQIKIENYRLISASWEMGTLDKPEDTYYVVIERMA